MNTTNPKISRRDAESTERTWKREGAIHVIPRGLSAVLAWLLAAVAVLAEPIEGCLPDSDAIPSPDAWGYTLVAKVKVRSVDRGTECVYWQGPAARSVGHPLDAEMVELLWKADDFDLSRLLVPAWKEDDDASHPALRRRADPDLEAGRYATGEVVPLVCRREGEWNVVEWIVPAGIWEKYRRQKEEGTFDRGFSPEDDAWQEWMEAQRQNHALWTRTKAGELTREEYQRLSAPLQVILSRTLPITLF